MLISYVVVEVAVVLQCVAGWSFRPSSTVEKVTCLNRSHLKLVSHLLPTTKHQPTPSVVVVLVGFFGC